MPEPLPEVNKFAGGAIVRFQNNRSKDLIMKTVKTKFLYKIVGQIFPFYNARTQYKIR